MSKLPIRMGPEGPLPTPAWRQPPPPHEDEIELGEFGRVLMRNRWIVLGCTVLGLGGAAAWGHYAPRVYEASTVIRIDEAQPSVVGPDLGSAFGPRGELETEMEVLRTFALLEEVADRLRLQVSVQSPAGPSRGPLFAQLAPAPSASAELRAVRRADGRFDVFEGAATRPSSVVGPGETVGIPGGGTFVLAAAAVAYPEIRFQVRSREAAAASLRGGIQVSRPNRDANIVVVTYRGAEPSLVQRVPDAIAEVFIEHRRDITKTEARSTVAFLERQIQAIGTELQDAEADLLGFRQGEGVVSIQTEASEQVRALARIQAERNAIDAERVALAELLAEVRATAAQEGEGEGLSPYRRLMAFPTLMKNNAASGVLESLSELESQHATLLQQRTSRSPNVQAVTGRIAELEQELRSVAVTYLQGLTSQVRSLDATLAAFGDELKSIPDREIQLARLDRRTSVLEEMHTLLQTRLKEAEIAQAVVDPSVRVVDPARYPAGPVAPRIPFLLALGLMGGMATGVAGAFARERTDRSVHTREDVSGSTGAPVLGLIPRIQGNRRRRLSGRRRVEVGEGPVLEHRLVTGRDPRNPVSEAYRVLRTNIAFATRDRAPRTVMFTSPMPKDGKTTVAANLAITLAQQRLKVLLVDADMRRGIAHTLFGLEAGPGLSDMLLGSATFQEVRALVDVGGGAILQFIPAGAVPGNPSELLGSARMRTFLEKVEEHYDYVVLDSPPLNLVTDAAVLGTVVDGVIVVARAGATHKGALLYAIEHLRNVRAPVLGCVLNDLVFERDAKYHGSYGMYGHPQYYGIDGRTEERV